MNRLPVEVRLRCDAWSGWEADAAGETDAVCVRAAGLPLVAVTDPLLSSGDGNRRAGPLPLLDSLEATCSTGAPPEAASPGGGRRHGGARPGEDGGASGVGAVCDAVIVTAASGAGHGAAAMSRFQSLTGPRAPPLALCAARRALGALGGVPPVSTASSAYGPAGCDPRWLRAGYPPALPARGSASP